MKRNIFLIAIAAVMLAAGLALPSSGQSTRPANQARYPQWTGAGYPVDRHLAIMLVQFDNAAVNMAQGAQSSTASADVKGLAADVIAQRSRELTSMRAEYQKRYGEAPPAWGAANGDYGAMRGNGSGMMGGTMGQMMAYGDGYQTMMGNSSNWWGGVNAGTSFVPALMRLDAMQISMATLGLQSNAGDLGGLYRTVISARTSELARLSKML